jgi:hypothetical protein
MPSYLVETYQPTSPSVDVQGTAGRLQEAVEGLACLGVAIRYLRATVVPDDETCFHLVEASGIAAVEEACRRAGLDRARVVPAIEDPARLPQSHA